MTDVGARLGTISIPNVPAGLLDELVIRYSGEVYGGGATLACGGEHWFTSVTGTYAKTSLSGDFDSKVNSQSWQPRLGYITWAYETDAYQHRAVITADAGMVTNREVNAALADFGAHWQGPATEARMVDAIYHRIGGRH